ncbi:permease [uncultured Thiocystis sp.]|uniref:permease n=1 Tax=uncultured Thiocystis sp. TaxID=1202134 RepID=UPI0034169DBC
MRAKTVLDRGSTLLAVTRLSRATALGEALHFFFYETPKVLLLLIGIVFLMGVIQTFFAPERTRALLAGRRLGLGNAMAASLGIVTPFCSCSAVPLFIGFVSAGVPLGVTFSFLIAAPMVNEVALALLLGLFGWKVAALYLGLGLAVAIAAGAIIGKLKMERYLEDWVRAIHLGEATAASGPVATWPERLATGRRHVREIVGRVWPYVLIGIGLGAAIHGYVPEDFMAAFMGRDVWWAVPAAVVLGVPMYTNAAGIVPIVEALIGKGAALGTTLAFMMSVIALSAPEMLILRKVLKWPLIATFIGVVATGILLVGYVFNLVL